MFGTAVRVAAWRREQRGQPAERPEVLSPSRTEAAGVGLTTQKALDALPFRARVVLVGIDVAGYAVEEIAHVMGIDAHEAEGLLEDARARFAAALDR